MSYQELFERGNTYDGRLYIYLTRPSALKTPEEIAREDARALQYIRDCEHGIEMMKEHRQALAARYAQLETMLYTDTLKLERDPRWDGKKYYHVTITRRFEDGTEQEQLRETFTGKERREAFKRFEELKKKYPGIKTEQNTARRAWEH